ncbi:hypothetical protein ACRAWD_06535 [Caulobacter segnis]
MAKAATRPARAPPRPPASPAPAATLESPSWPSRAALMIGKEARRSPGFERPAGRRRQT